MNVLKPLAVASAFLAGPSAAEHIVIVHGAFQSAADWTDVGAALGAQGHDVTVVNLPGRDAEGAAAQAVTLADHVATTLIERAGIDINSGHAPQTTQVDALVTAILQLAGGA